MSVVLLPDGLSTGPKLHASMVRRAEEDLGLGLPGAFVDLLYATNGGRPSMPLFPVAFENSWAPDHIEISTVLGIGGTFGIDSTSETSSAHLIREWDYPEIGIVLAFTPSGGFDVVMLDYAKAAGEPRVVYVDEDRTVHELAGSFQAFLDGLRADLDRGPDF